MWSVDGIPNSVRIAGSVHYLRDSDHPLPEALRRAYEAADVLVVEYDVIGDGMPVRPRDLASSVPRAGRLQTIGPLRRSVSTREFTELRRLAERRDLDIFLLDRMKPWFAGMYVVDRELEEAGFESDLGVDNHLMRRAREEGKPVLALESRDEQRRMFEQIPRSQQIDFLVQSLKEAPLMAEAMDRLVRIWRAGDMDALERNLLHPLQAKPSEYERFSLARNLRWSERMDAFMGAEEDYLVVVGTAHLLGPESLIERLHRRGYALSRWP